MAQTEQASIKRPTIYFYHTRPTDEAYKEWKAFKFPGHLMYGQPLLSDYGIDSVMHPFTYYANRCKLIWDTTKKILSCKKKYDALYATSFRGIELIIFLRALGLYRKPIILWHHTAVTTAKSKFRELISRFFYRGIDQMFFFSQKLIEDSLKTKKAPKEKLHLIHWGPDLPFYDKILEEVDTSHRQGFISTGKENRDVPTLINAFSKGAEELDLYISETCGNLNYKQIINRLTIPPTVRVHFTSGIIPYELGKMVAAKQCIVICCLEFPYTVGLTTLVEALALGMPVICSKNPNFEMDIEKEKIGITVDYNDTEGWTKAIHYLETHPEEAQEMGKNARRLAEEKFNLHIFSKEIADVILQTLQR